MPASSQRIRRSSSFGHPIPLSRRRASDPPHPSRSAARPGSELVLESQPGEQRVGAALEGASSHERPRLGRNLARSVGSAEIDIPQRVSVISGLLPARGKRLHGKGPADRAALGGTGSRRMQRPAREEPWVDPTWTRLEDQDAEYDRKGAEAQRTYKRLKVFQVVLATFIRSWPASRTAWPSSWLSRPTPAVAIGCSASRSWSWKACQHLSQYHQNWLSYRATCEALKHEKFLFLADAGPYGDTEDKRAHCCAERIEELIGKEHRAVGLGPHPQLRRPALESEERRRPAGCRASDPRSARSRPRDAVLLDGARLACVSA